MPSNLYAVDKILDKRFKNRRSKSDNESEIKSTKDSSDIDHIEQTVTENDRVSSNAYIEAEIGTKINDYNTKSDLSINNIPMVDDDNTSKFDNEYFNSKLNPDNESETTFISDSSDSIKNHSELYESDIGSAVFTVKKCNADYKSIVKKVRPKYRKRKRSAGSAKDTPRPIGGQNKGVGNHEHVYKRKYIADKSVQRKMSATKTLTYDRSPATAILNLQDVQKLFKKGKILPILPCRDEKKIQMYQVVQRLSQKTDQKIIPHFFWCSICETVLHINTSTHYPALNRHYNKCVEIQAKEQSLGNSGRKNLQQMIEDIMKIFSDSDRVDLSAVKLPKVFSKENCDAYIEKIGILLESQKHKTRAQNKNQISSWIETEMSD